MKRKVLMCTLAVMGFSTLVVPAISAQNVVVQESQAETTEVEPRTNILEWRFKVIGDHLYKRLYNCSTGEWESDWILVA